MKNVIKEIIPGSIAEEVQIEVGDILLKINDTEIIDIIDYRFLSADEELLLEIQKKNGEVWEIEIEKNYGEELGIEFDGGLLDKAKSCSNKCIFCFIDQLPKGMRDTLYFKDDDSRLSFLQGNFVTLTNMKDEDIDRIIRYRISPINVSVHTTNPKLREIMLTNRFAGNILDRMKKLKEAGIQMNAQIVCIPEVNDKEELKRTVLDLYSLYPEVNNVAVVPIGITKYREGLYKVNKFTKESSKETIALIEEMQKKFYSEVNEPFVRLSDEFYLVAKQEIPSEDYYNGYEQIEDGVGVTRCFRNNIERTLQNLDKDSKGSYSIVTAELSYDEVLNAKNKICKANPNIHIDVFKIINNFFGNTITVTGLLTGKDIIEQLRGKINTKYLFMADNMFRRGYELAPEQAIMLDDITIADIERELNIKVITCDFSGEDLIELINKYDEEEI